MSSNFNPYFPLILLIALTSCARPGLDHTKLRQDLASMATLIEKQDYSSGKLPIDHRVFADHCLSLQTDFKLLNAPELAPAAARCQNDLDALDHFWARYSINPDCVQTNAGDLAWLRATDLMNDTNVWMAFDFAGDRRWFESGQSAAAQDHLAILRASGLQGGELAKHENQVKVTTLENESAFLGRRLTNMDSILSAAADSRSHIYPAYVVGKLLKRVKDDCNQLLKDIQVQ